LNQIRTVDKQRLGHFWGRLGPETMARVDRAIEISLGLVPL
jgi:mRNA-degrading endonuclease toxin of MazEF toxin-antitoxin module